jgi:predicted permease
MTDRRDDELEREIRTHLELEAEERVAEGMSETDAAYAARRAFGNVTRTREDVRFVWGRVWLEQLGQDIRHAIRVCRTSPAFTLVTVLTLALGIGANTAIFSLMDGVLFRPLPVTEPDRLVTLAAANDVDPGSPLTRFSYPLLEILRGNSEVLSSLIAYQKYPLTLDADAGAERAMGMVVTGDYFTALGVRAAVGRTLHLDDNRPRDGKPVTVISYGFWQRRFAADRHIVGRKIRINGHPFTIVGVAQQGFFGTEVGVSSDVWLPLWAVGDIAGMLTNPSASILPAIARLKPGITRELAQERVRMHLAAAMETRARGAAARQLPQLLLLPGTEALSNVQGQFSTPLWVLMATVALVLLIACCNVAGLLLVRGVARSRDIALRAALGASRTRLVRSLIVESLILSGAGMLGGIAAAYWGVRGLIALLPADRIVIEIQPNAMVLAFGLAVTLAVGLLLGLVPAVHAMRLDLRGLMGDGTPGVSAGTRIGLRQLLVSSQVAFSVVLLVGAGLFVQSLHALRNVDAGVEAEQVLQVTLDVRPSGYGPQAGAQVYDRLQEAVQALPDVRSAAFIDMPLFGTYRARMDVYPPGYAGEDNQSVFDIVSPGAFETLGIPIVAGRDFSDRDDRASRRVIIVNEAMARHFFGDENPAGRYVGEGGDPDFEIIGVVGATKFRSMREASQRMIFLPFGQYGRLGERTLYVRTAGDPLALAESVRAAMREVEPTLALYGVKTFSQQIGETLVQERLTATLSAWFGTLALLLAGLGLYGLIHYNVQRRRREFGLRLALGAAPATIARAAVGEAGILVGTGIAVGLLVAIPLARVVQSLLFGVAPTELSIFIAAAATMGSIAVVAAALPSWRATRINPLEALRTP